MEGTAGRRRATRAARGSSAAATPPLRPCGCTRRPRPCRRQAADCASAIPNPPDGPAGSSRSRQFNEARRGLIVRATAEHGVQHVPPPTRQAEHRLVVLLATGPLAIVVT